MTTLLGAMLGFFTSMLPELVTFLKDKNDRQHELQILSLQLKQQRMNQADRLEAISLENEIKLSNGLYKTFYSNIRWVDAFNATVRPVLAYAFFALYVWVKIVAVLSLSSENTPSFVMLYHTLWTQEDAAIFAGIISFYFGQRSLMKMRGGG